MNEAPAIVAAERGTSARAAPWSDGERSGRPTWHTAGALAIVAAATCAFMLPASGAVAGLAVLLAAAAAIGLVSAGMRWPGADLLVLVVVAALIPLESTVGHSGVSASLPLAAVVCGGWLLREVAGRRRLVFARSGVVIASLAFVAVAVLAFLVGQFPWFAVPGAPLRAQAGQLTLFLVSGALLLMVAHDTRSVTQVHRVTWLFIGAGTVAVLATVVGAAELRIGRLSIATSSSIGSVFFTWLVALSAGQALWNRRLPRGSRCALAAIAVLVPLHQLLRFSSWASGWLPPLVALGVVLLVRFPRFVSGAALLCLPLALWSGRDAMDMMLAHESYSWTTRLEAATSLSRLVAHNPWIGFGPANYYFYTPLFPILGYRVSFNSHNNYLDLLAQVGVLGLAAFLCLVIALARAALRVARRIPWGFEHAYLVGSFGGVIGSATAGMLGDWITPFVYNVGLRGFRSSLFFWLFAGGVVALDRLSRDRRRCHAGRVPGP